MSDKPKYPITVTLLGSDGNALMIVGRVRRAIRDYHDSHKSTPAEREAALKEFSDEALSGDYNQVIRTCMNWVHVD